MISTAKKTKKEKPVGDRYHSVTPATQDNLWKVRQKHEYHLVKLWHWKWDFLLEPDFEPKFRRESIDQSLEAEGKRLPLLKYKEFEKRTYPLNESPPLPIKSADLIGWRSTIKENSLDMFPTKCTKPPKVCFRDEQYGYYRTQKYLMKDRQEIEEKKEEEQFVLPRKTIVHNINPLIC